jgi:hypothetical protein
MSDFGSRTTNPDSARPSLTIGIKHPAGRLTPGNRASADDERWPDCSAASRPDFHRRTAAIAGPRLRAGRACAPYRRGNTRNTASARAYATRISQTCANNVTSLSPFPATRLCPLGTCDSARLGSLGTRLHHGDAVQNVASLNLRRAATLLECLVFVRPPQQPESGPRCGRRIDQTTPGKGGVGGGVAEIQRSCERSVEPDHAAPLLMETAESAVSYMECRRRP